MDSVEHPGRPRIAEIIASSGSIAGSGAASPDVIAQVAALAASIAPGVSAGTLAASESLAEALVSRFKLSRDAVVTRDYTVPYETVGRALVLALHAANWQLRAAYDTASGAVLEATKAMTLLEPSYTLTIALGDTGPSAARISATSHIPILNVLKFNERTLAALFAQVDAYVARFAT